MDEMDRNIAVLKGSYIAKHFPATWYALKDREAKQEETEAQKLRDQLDRLFSRPRRKK